MSWALLQGWNQTEKERGEKGWRDNSKLHWRWESFARETVNGGKALNHLGWRGIKRSVVYTKYAGLNTKLLQRNPFRRKRWKSKNWKQT